MGEMTVVEAIRKVEEIHQRGIEARNRPRGTTIEEMLTYRSGKVGVYTGRVQRGVLPCRYCGGWTGMGEIVVRHEDGREVTFGVELYHYAEAGHPIMPEDVDGEILVAIMADA